jgi:hypothetical protein
VLDVTSRAIELDARDKAAGPGSPLLAGVRSDVASAERDQLVDELACEE